MAATPAKAGPTKTALDVVGDQLTSVQSSLNDRMAAFEEKLANIQALRNTTTDTHTGTSPDQELTLLASSFIEFKDHCLKELALIQTVVSELKTRVTNCEDRTDQLEQYSRRNCLLIHGVREQSGENTYAVTLDIINNAMGVKLGYDDIDRVHRIGAPNRSGADKMIRPIIIKFISYQAREAVWRAKIKLKGSRIVLSESLTRERQEIFRAARAKFGKNSCWTYDGNVVVMDSDGRKTYVRRMADIPVTRDIIPPSSNNEDITPTPKI